MQKFHAYKQLNQMDCGPTCLRMVVKHYGKIISFETLRQHSGFSKEGVSLLGIAEAAEKIGFRTLGVKVPFKKLIEDAPFPFVLTGIKIIL